jgi:peptide/nickel transport system permease protein
VLQVGIFAATLIGAQLAVNLLFAVAPGDAIDTLPNADELRPALEAEWGLGGSVPSRLVAGLARSLRGNLGYSLTLRPGAPVAELLADHGLRSLSLLVLALAVMIVAAWAQPFWPRPLRRAARLVLPLSAVPTALLALATVNGINETTWWLVERGVIARPDWFALPTVGGAVRSAVAVFVLATGSGALAAASSRATGALDALRSASFVEAERARGGPIGLRFWPHLAVAVADAVAAGAAGIVGGLAVVETGLGLGGVGALFFGACRARDWPVAVGAALAMAVAVAAARLFAQLVGVILDPRRRA